MSFLEEDFSPVGGQSGSTDTQASGESKGINEFSYSTPDALATVIALGYFNELRDRIYKNDIIHLVSDIGSPNPADIDYTLIRVESSPRSPSAVDVALDGLKIRAT